MPRFMLRVLERAAGLAIGGLVLASLAKLGGLDAARSLSWPRLLAIDVAAVLLGLAAVAAYAVGLQRPRRWWSAAAWRELADDVRERRARDQRFEQFLREGPDRRRRPANGGEPAAPAPAAIPPAEERAP
jgi:hypothetical protein